MIPAFDALYKTRVDRLSIRAAPNCLLCFDPGETTGVAIFHGPKLFASGQPNTSSVDTALKELSELFAKFQPNEVVLEDYRVYGNRAEQHIGSSLSTPRLIGMIETLCLQGKIPFHKQPAQTPKQFVTDDKLRAWGFYKTGHRHARDAIRHGCYYILFPPKALTSQQILRGVRSKTAGQHVG